MIRSTDAGISEFTQTWFARETLKWAAPVVTLDKFGMAKPMPKNSGDTVQFRRPKIYDAMTAPLQEGVTPTPKGDAQAVRHAGADHRRGRGPGHAARAAGCSSAGR
jgi:N4-gp56 family major capsid protein